MLARRMSLHHGLTDPRDNGYHLTCFTDMLYSSMVPGNLPSQLEILSTGQNYYGTRVRSQSVPVLHYQHQFRLSVLGTGTTKQDHRTGKASSLEKQVPVVDRVGRNDRSQNCLWPLKKKQIVTCDNAIVIYIFA